MKLAYLEKLPECGVALDTETWWIRDGLLAPPLVLGSIARLDTDVWDKLQAGLEVPHDADPLPGRLLSKLEVCLALVGFLDDPDCIIIGANIAFDFAVLANALAKIGIDIFPRLFEALEDGRVYDLLIAQALDAIANGHLGEDPRTGRPLVNPGTGKRDAYSLSMCVSLNLGREDAKANDEYRQRYHEFDGVPLDQLPPEAAQYPVDDAKNTAETALAQVGFLPRTTPHHTWGDEGVCTECGAEKSGGECLVRRPLDNLLNLSAQTYAAFALQLGAVWGFHVNQSNVDLIEEYYNRERDKLIGPHIASGLIREDGTENRALLKRKIALAYGCTEPCPVCEGSGKVPADDPRQLQCKACRGRCAPWKAGGKIKEPTVAHCDACGDTGKVRDPKHVVCCHGDGDEKTCDGTGLLLVPGVPLSKSEGIGYGADPLFESGDEDLISYAEFGEYDKWPTYIAYLRRGREPVAGHAEGCLILKQEAKKRRCTCDGPHRDIRLTLKPRVLGSDTARVTYGDPIQTFPRWLEIKYKGDDGQVVTIPSFRQCIQADDGWGHSSEDFKAGELVCLSQVTKALVGCSDLGDVLLSKDSKGDSMDPHAILALEILGVTYEEYITNKKIRRFVDARQSMKPENFGRPAGMGDAKIVLTQRRQGPDTVAEDGPHEIEDDNGDLVRGYRGLRFCKLAGFDRPCGERKTMEWNGRPCPPLCVACLEVANKNGKIFKKRWSEMPRYFQYVTQCVDGGMRITADLLERWPALMDFYIVNQQLEPGQVMHLWTGRLRGGLTFTEAANGWFQGFLADITKAAYCRVARECYDRTVRVPSMLHANAISSKYAGMRSPLYGSRAPGFYHDEIFATHPLAMLSDASWRIAEIMRDTMRHACPDYADAAVVDPAAMIDWAKNAEKVVHGGKLVPWTPKHDTKKCPECQAAKIVGTGQARASL